MREIEIPDAAVQLVAQRLYDRYESEYVADHLSWRDFADEARANLDVAAHLLLTAELRHLIDEVEQLARREGESKASKPYRDAREMFVARLRLRARELDLQGGTR